MKDPDLQIRVTREIVTGQVRLSAIFYRQYGASLASGTIITSIPN